MAFFPDLTPYCYRGMIQEDTYNVGWLEPEHSFPLGRTSKLFGRRLLQYCSVFVNSMRAIHACGLCTPKSGPVIVQFGEQALKLGFAEIRVFGDGRIYAAPNLIYHYVVEHSYKPPKEFIDAVLQGPQALTDEYFSLLKATGLSFFVPNDAECARVIEEYEDKMKSKLAEIMKDAAKGKRQLH